MDQQDNLSYEYAPADRASVAGVLSARTARRCLSFVFCLVAMLATVGLAHGQKKNSCLECHVKLEGRLGDPARKISTDIHLSRGLACNDCHGGDPSTDDKAAAKDARKGFIGKPRTVDIPAFCGKCHSDANLMKKFNPSLRVDQEREYATSMHGKLLTAGDQKVATCISCHGVHGIRAVADPLSSVYAANVAETCAKCHADAGRMQGYQIDGHQIPTDQYAKYKKGVHAAALYGKQDLSAPTCNDCHGNHGAAPPGIASVANVCGQCHVKQAELFQASPHKAAFDKAGLGECVRCHSNHEIAKPTDQMLGTGAQAVCITCHQPGDKGFIAAGQMRAQIDELLQSVDRSTEILNHAERAGMEVSRPKFELRDAVDGVTHARVLIHSSSLGEVEKFIGPGLAASKKGYQAGVDAMAERRFRREGLVVSLVFILFLAGLVYLKVRDIERRQAAQGST